MKKTHVLSLVALLGIAAFGAGCVSSSNQAAVNTDIGQAITTDQGSTDTSALTTTATSSDQVAPVTDTSTSTEPTTTTTTSMTQEKLAYPGILPDAETANKIVRIKTSKGEIVFELLPKEGPMAASNFVYLTKKGFYDGLTFHRVETWVVQGGDPEGTGMGGPGYTIAEDKVNLPYTRGIVAMAKTMAPHSTGSQFFIMTKDVPLDPDYSIFGRVISGMDVVDKIAVGDVMSQVTVEAKK